MLSSEHTLRANFNHTVLQIRKHICQVQYSTAVPRWHRPVATTADLTCRLSLTCGWPAGPEHALLQHHPTQSSRRRAGCRPKTSPASVPLSTAENLWTPDHTHLTTALRPTRLLSWAIYSRKSNPVKLSRWKQATHLEIQDADEIHVGRSEPCCVQSNWADKSSAQFCSLLHVLTDNSLDVEPGNKFMPFCVPVLSGRPTGQWPTETWHTSSMSAWLQDCLAISGTRYCSWLASDDKHMLRRSPQVMEGKHNFPSGL